MMNDLVKAGKIRYWGISNYSGWQLAVTTVTARERGLIAPMRSRFTTPEAREAEYELLPAAQELGLGTMVWSPLGEGLLTTGRIDRNTPAPAGTRQGSSWSEPWVVDQERLFRVIDALKAVAAEQDVSVPQVVLAWLRDRRGVDAIMLGARQEEQLRDNLASLDVTLSPEQAARIEEAGRPLAIYPFWHRAQLSTDRPSPSEEGYLRCWRASQGMNPSEDGQ